MPTGKQGYVVVEIREQNIFTEFVEGLTRVPGKPIGHNVLFRLHEYKVIIKNVALNDCLYDLRANEMAVRGYAVTGMVKLNLPSFEYDLRQDGGKVLIFDFLRKRHVALTPENGFASISFITSFTIANTLAHWSRWKAG